MVDVAVLSAEHAKLRIGVMLDGTTVPAWIARILRQIEAASFARLSLLVLNAEPLAPRRRFDRLRSPRRQRSTFSIYQHVDARLFRSDPDAFADVDMADELRGMPEIHAVPRRPKPFEHRFEPETIAAVRDAGLDVLLRFGFNIIRGEILDCARFGVWSYHHGDNRYYRGSPAFFWEMYEDNPVTGTMLQVLSDELDAGRTIYRSFSATDQLSLHRGRNGAYWKSADFVIRCLTVLHERGWAALESRPEFREVGPYTRGIYRTPTNTQTARFVARLVYGTVVRHVRKLVLSDDWHVGYRRVPGAISDALGELPTTATSRRTTFHLMQSPPDRSYADPMVVHENGRHYLFFEDYEVDTGRGVISWSHFGEDGAPRPARRALERDYHLSYPFVFGRNEAWYMISETRENRTIELFQAVDFPARWTFERVLIPDIEAVDATLIEYESLLWLFVNVAVPGASINDELCLFYARSLGDEWTPHPLNPVVSDVRCARPAGGVFSRDGLLIRPSQDCSRRYGYATVFNRVTTLTETEYAESPIGRLDAGWRRGNLATHTFNAAGAYQVVDAQRPSLNVPRLLSRCRR